MIIKFDATKVGKFFEPSFFYLNCRTNSYAESIFHRDSLLDNELRFYLIETKGLQSKSEKNFNRIIFLFLEYRMLLAVSVFLLPFAFCLSTFPFCLLSCSWLLVARCSAVCCLVFVVQCFRVWRFSLFALHSLFLISHRLIFSPSLRRFVVGIFF